MKSRMLIVSKDIRNEIKELIFKTNLSEEDAKDSCYAVLIPKHFKVSDLYLPKHQRIAVEKIAYHQAWHHSLEIVLTILHELANQTEKDQKIKQMNEFVVKAKKSIHEWQEKKEFSLTELYACFKSLETFSSELQKIVKSVQAEQLRAHCKELTIWLDGIYLSLSILIKRKEIQESITDTSVEISKRVPHPVDERKSMITTGEKSTLVHLSEADERLILTIILMVMSEIYQKIIPHPQLQQTVDAITYCMSAVLDENEMRNKSKLEQLAELEKSKDMIIPTLEKFLSEIKKIQVIPEIQSQCKELALLFEGKYYETYKDTKKKIFWDIKNETIKAKTDNKVTRMQMAGFLHQAALALEALSAQPFNMKTEEKKSDQAHSSQQSGEEIDSELQLINTLSQARRKLAVELIKLVVAIPSEREINVDEAIQTIKTALAGKSEAIVSGLKHDKDECNAVISIQEKEEAFWRILDQSVRSEEQTKIEALFNAFSQYGLSNNQKGHLLYLNQEVPALFAGYKNNRYRWQKFVSGIPMVGYFLDPYLQRANVDVADQTLNNKEVDPDTHLKNLFMARLLLSGRNSNELSPRIDKLLLGVYTHLHNMRKTFVPAVYGQYANQLMFPPPAGQVPDVSDVKLPEQKDTHAVLRQ